MPWWLLIALTVAVFALNAYAAHRDFRNQSDALGAAALLVLLLELSILCHSGEPDGIGNMVWLALFDLGGVALSVWWFVTKPALWKSVLAVSFVAQLFAHAGYWSHPGDNRNEYIAVLNVLSVLQKLAVASPGAWYVARDIGRFMRARRLRDLHFLGRGR